MVVGVAEEEEEAEVEEAAPMQAVPMSRRRCVVPVAGACAAAAPPSSKICDSETNGNSHAQPSHWANDISPNRNARMRRTIPALCWA